MFVSVHPDFDYVRLKVDNEVWIMAKNLAGAFMGVVGKQYEILEEMKGTQLEGLKYVHPFLGEVPEQQKIAAEIKNAHKVHAVGGEIFEGFVTLTAGTGCVHSSTGTGPEDQAVGKHFGVPAFCPIDEDGTFTKDAGKYAGLIAKKDDTKFIEEIKSKGLLVFESPVEHEYPHCWRCKKPVIFRAADQWYLAVSNLKQKMLAENKKIKWTPDWAGEKWFHSWLENLQDWCISRQRYWGIPLPIWQCTKCDNVKVIGSRSELPAPLKDLHRPWIDQVTFKCEKCKSEMKRIPDVLDVWLDSGAAPWATLPFPEGGKEILDKWFPADFILEGKDQIRGWFNSLMSLSMVSHGFPSYKAVYLHGFVSDSAGMKMSKSIGNVVSPDEVVEKYGADAWRFYCLRNNPGEDLKFAWKDVEESYRALNILWNTAVFAKYMELEKFNPETYKLDKAKLQPEDKWILSRLNTLNEKVTHAFETYNFHEVPKLLHEFIVEGVSRWYVKLIRSRTWVSAKGEDKLVAFKVLYEVLKKFLVLAAPVIPMLTEEVYQNFVRPLDKKFPESIHLMEWPKPETIYVDLKSEENMKVCRKIVETSLNIREDAKIKLRWPLKLLTAKGEKVSAAVEMFSEVIKEQANVKSAKAGETKGVAKDFEYGKVYLDTEITPEIMEEALAREVMRAVQVLRKKHEFKVEEKISLTLSSSDEFSREALNKFRQEIVEKVGAAKLDVSTQKPKLKFEGDLDFEGKKIEIGFDKK